ncbi:vicilin Cor a 11.0101-like [Nicotiana tabacum]|uniref:Vicilin Cor a 11.0101-like n=2 Tax=Nicotiana TaxID=4085 RepID=A0A1S3XNB9_TOBAC|nr:PREDICTED: vicilin-like antimicrobial peptides 2-3 [Nicotiana sylvestris]XP_016441418.1 PREDICTED: vicilin-like antimicrobial peptides 2-3 [Nicotiana tabacum]
MVKVRPFLFCVLLLAVASLALGTKDPELKQCKHQCKALQQIGEHQRKECYEMCERYHSEKQSKEEDTSTFLPYRGREETGEEEEQQYGEQERENPYVFEDQHFITGIKTQHGRIRVLPKFTERSKLLKGIENYRVAILEANPQTFIVPNHWDADAVLFVAQGRGTLNLVRRGKRNSFNIRAGDVIRVHAGTTAYLINRDNNEKLVIAKLLNPVSTPGQFEHFFGPGGRENPESFYNAFSSEILESALNVRRDRLQRLFGQQREGVIIRASEEQIRAMSQHEEGGIWPFGGESKGSVNLYRQRPLQSNQYGQLYEVDGSHYRQLEDLDISVSLANITQGGMFGPAYSSRATKIAVVVDGEGYFEMACPHLASESGSRGRQSRGSERETRIGSGYQKVRARLRRGMVVIIPAGHPVVNVASNNQNLQVVCFNINARNNEIVPLAGRNNVMSQLEREAMELGFGIPAREVEEIFRSQQEEFFFQGPGGRQQHQEGGRADA